jgi:lipopolysaccharide export system permease protein
MTIFSRYVFRQAGGALLIVLLSLSGMVWIALALRQLNVVTSLGQSALTLLEMTTLGVPGFMAVIAPFALLIAVIHTLNRLNSDSEIIVYTASGATTWAVARPLLALALLTALFISFVNHFAMPWSLRHLREMVLQVRTDLLTQVIQPGRFSSPEQGLTLHIRERTFNGVLEGLIMHDARDPKLIQSYLAERGVLVKQDDTAYLVMTDGHIVRRTDPKEPAQIIAFDKYAIDLDEFEGKSTVKAELKPRELYFGELMKASPKGEAAKKSPGQFTAELHERFSSALYPIAFTFIALACVGRAQSTRQRRGLRVGTGFAAAVATRLAGLAANNVVVLKPQALPLLYLIPFAGILVPLLVIAGGRRLRGGTPWFERGLDALASLAALFKRTPSRPAAAFTRA